MACTTESPYTQAVARCIYIYYFLSYMVFIVLPTLFYLQFLVPLFPSLLLLKIVQNLVYKAPYLLPNGQVSYLLIRILYLISLHLQIAPFPLTLLESASALCFYLSPAAMSTCV